MTMIVGIVSPLVAVVAADAVTFDSRTGRNIHLSKLRPIASARTVITARGDVHLVRTLADAAEELRSFDEIAAAAPDIVERAYERLAPAAPASPGWFSEGYEVYIVGRSDRTRSMHATVLIRDADGFSRHEIPPTNSFLAPWSRDALGEKPLGPLLEDEGLVAAARTQAAWLRGLDPAVQVGGDLVAARIDASRITIETIAKEI